MIHAGQCVGNLCSYAHARQNSGYVHVCQCCGYLCYHAHDMLFSILSKMWNCSKAVKGTTIVGYSGLQGLTENEGWNGGSQCM